jgi:2-dehydropantoate 2-reductase
MPANHVEYAILGAGAMGSILAAHLARSGRRVVLLARGQRARDIEQRGVRITGLAEISESVPVLTDVSRFTSADVFIVATKTHGTDAALHALRHAEVGAALSIQNGLMKNDQLAAVWGADHVLGALADTSGELLPSGETLFTRNERISIGELQGGTSPRAQRIAETIDASGVRAGAVPDIRSLEWSKFAAWTGMMVLTVTTRAVTWKVLADPGTSLVLARLVREVAALAAACNVPLSDHAPLPVASIARGSEAEAVAAIRALGQRLKAAAPNHRMSALQDLEAARPLEIAETLGAAVRLANQMALPLPLLESCWALASGIDRIRRGAEPPTQPQPQP